MGPGRRLEAAAAVVLGMVAVATVAIPPVARPIVELCLVNRLTGAPCPGCGMTRAFLLLGHGRVAEAVALNPLSPALYLLLWGSLVLLAVRLMRRPRRRSSLTGSGPRP